MADLADAPLFATTTTQGFAVPDFAPATPQGFVHLGQPAEDTPTTHDVQAAVEGVPEGGDRLEFLGEEFRLADEIGEMPVMAFAAAAQSGLNAEDMSGMAAMYAMIRDCIHRPPLYDTDPQSETFGKRLRDPLTGKYAYDESEWARFQQHAMDERATGEELFAFVGDVMAIIAARPPQQRSASSRYSPRTSPKSKESSSSPATRVPPGFEGMTPVADLGR